MKITVERLPESQVQLDIEIDQERVDQSLVKVSRKVAQQVRIPGFRPGKAPRHIIEQRIGRDELIREAINQIVPDIYNEAIEAESIDAIGQPEVEITEVDPPRVKATVSVRPTVDLGDYRAIRIERDPVEVTDELVDEQLDILRRRHATYVPVERAAVWTDMLIADVSGSIDGDEPFIDETGAEFQIVEGRRIVFDGVAEAIVGMEPGETKSFEVPVPEDVLDEELRGKPASITVTLHEVKEEQLPDLDDDFASLVNAEEFEKLDELTARIREDLERELNSTADAKLQQEALEALVAGAAIEFPRLLVDHEIDHEVSNAVENDQRAYRAYLQRIGQSETDFRETFREAAEERVRNTLVLEQFERDEDIDVPDTEIEQELDEIVARLGENGARLREQLMAGDGMSTLRRNTIRRKALERLKAIVSGQADDGGEAEPEPPAGEDPQVEEAVSGDE